MVSFENKKKVNQSLVHVFYHIRESIYLFAPAIEWQGQRNVNEKPIQRIPMIHPGERWIARYWGIQHTLHLFICWSKQFIKMWFGWQIGWHIIALENQSPGQICACASWLDSKCCRLRAQMRSEFWGSV